MLKNRDLRSAQLLAKFHTFILLGRKACEIWIFLKNYLTISVIFPRYHYQSASNGTDIVPTVKAETLFLYAFNKSLCISFLKVHSDHLSFLASIQDDSLLLFNDYVGYNWGQSHGKEQKNAIFYDWPINSKIIHFKKNIFSENE